PAPVVVEGTIKEVCQIQGCWFTLTDGSPEQSRDYFSNTLKSDFTLPINSVGKHARVTVQADAVTNFITVLGVELS
ncbi:MAG: DUF4920 domain-containing protein, partial [bacterium]